MDFDANWLWITLVLPVVVGIFKHEIGRFFSDYTVYKNRRFDSDGDPGTGQHCYVQSGATGEYVKIYVDEYTFGLAPSSRKVITQQKDPEGDEWKVIVVPYSYTQWASMVRGSLQKDRTERVLLDKQNLITILYKGENYD